MSATFERCGEPEGHDLVGESERDDAPAHREDVRVVVLARQARREEVVAESGADPADLVRRHLFALPATAQHDAPSGAALDDGAAHRQANWWIVGRRLAVGAVILHGVPEACERGLQMLFEEKTGVIGANRDGHEAAIVLWRLRFRVPGAGCWVLFGFGVQGSRFIVTNPSVVISARGEERVASGHPWIYRGDVADVRAAPGDTVVVRNPRGQTLGSAFYSDRSQIALRMLVLGEQAADEALIGRRLDAAIGFRQRLAIDATAFRLVHGEADLLPSLVVDAYGDYLVVQTLSQGTDRLLPQIVSMLSERLQPKGILARNDPRTRLLEGLEQRVEVVAGDVPEAIPVVENGIEYDVDVRHGQKTGLFLDQRENREAAARYARGRLLDCFCYNGGFALTLGKRCDETLAFDMSAQAIERVRQNAAHNGVTVDARVGNVFDELRGMERTRQRFDTIVLDPPAFAKSRTAVEKALAGYKEINLRALKLLNPGGILVTCSCSYNVSEGAFAEIVYEASVDARTHVTVVEKRMQGRDHPVLLGVPETYYLKCLILRKVG